MYHFSDITLLITHYNRSQSLEKLLNNFISFNVAFSKIIVCDDGSKIEHQNKLILLKEKYNFDLLSAPSNKGLGNNINKGQDAITSKYTLYIQEDFVPKPLFISKLKVAHQFFEDDEELDFVRFYAYIKYPYLKAFKEGFSQMIFKHAKFWQSYKKFHLYSDHPHLRRSNFFLKFGRYPEGIKPDRTEYYMMMKILTIGAKSYFYDDYKALINQENTITEPSTVKRNFWRENQNFIINIIRHIYRYVRFNLELIILKIKNNI